MLDVGKVIAIEMVVGGLYRWGGGECVVSHGHVHSECELQLASGHSFLSKETA